MRIIRRSRPLRAALLAIATVALVAAGCAAPSDDGGDDTTSDDDGTDTDADTDEDSDEGGDAAGDGASEEARTLRVAIPDDVETLDPAFGQAILTNTVLKNIYAQPVQYQPGPSEGAFAYADTTSFEGRALESWEFSDDRRTITLNVRQDTTFPDTGNPLDADDVIYGIERAFETQAGPGWVWNNIGVAGMDQVERIDDYTIQLNDVRPSSITEPLMRDQTLGVLDSELVQANATDEDPWALEFLGRNYAGNGQYVLESWETGTRMVLAANPDYWGEEPYFTRVELQVVPESANRLALLRDGAVDVALDLSTQELDSLEGAEGVQVVSIPDRGGLNLGMNMREAPFDDVRVRQALAYASPYEQIVDGVLAGRAVPSQGPISVNSRFFDLYDLGELYPYETDADKARELLAEAGYEDGFEFELIVPQGLPYVEETAANLRAAYEDIGVTMRIQPVSSAAMSERLAQRDFDAFLRGWLVDYVDDPYYHFFLWWGTDTVLNWVGYSDADVDAVLADTAEVVDDEARREPYRTAIGQVIEDSPMVWLANGDFTLAMRDDISGYTHDPDQLITFYTLSRE
jgi:peptide/nickel transport system substrate-binding protein